MVVEVQFQTAFCSPHEPRTPTISDDIMAPSGASSALETETELAPFHPFELVVKIDVKVQGGGFEASGGTISWRSRRYQQDVLVDSGTSPIRWLVLHAQAAAGRAVANCCAGSGARLDMSVAHTSPRLVGGVIVERVTEK